MSNEISFYNFLNYLQARYFSDSYDWDGNKQFNKVFDLVKETRRLSLDNIKDCYVNHSIDLAKMYKESDVLKLRVTCPSAVAIKVIRADIRTWADDKIKVHYALAREDIYNARTECLYLRIE